MQSLEGPLFKWKAFSSYLDTEESHLIKVSDYIQVFDAIAYKYDTRKFTHLVRLHTADQITAELRVFYCCDGKRFAPPDQNPYAECFEKAESIWRGVRQLDWRMPEKLEDKEKKTLFFLRKDMFEKLFSPLIPDSSLLHYTYECWKTNNRGISYRIASIGLLIEGIGRPLICSCGSFILDIYAFKNRDLAEYYRFRLYFNRTDPLVTAIRGLGILF